MFTAKLSSTDSNHSAATESPQVGYCLRFSKEVSRVVYHETLQVDHPRFTSVRMKLIMIYFPSAFLKSFYVIFVCLADGGLQVT